MSHRLLFGWFLLLAPFSGGCDDALQPDESLPGPGEPVAVVLNGLGETLSVVSLEDDRVFNDVLATGAFPNHLEPTPDGSKLLVTSSGANRVDVLDLDTWSIVGSIDLGPGSNPWSTELIDGSTAYVSELLTGQVARVDWTSGEVLARTAVGAGPEGMALIDDRLFVACTGGFPLPERGEVYVVEADTVSKVVSVGRNPQAFVVAGSELFVICSSGFMENAGRVMVIDAATCTLVDSLEVGGEPAWGVRDHDFIYLSGFSGGLLKFRWATREVVNDATDPVLPLEGLFGIEIDPATRRLHVASFGDDTIKIVEGDSLAAEWAVGDAPQQIVIRR